MSVVLDVSQQAALTLQLLSVRGLAAVDALWQTDEPGPALRGWALGWPTRSSSLLDRCCCCQPLAHSSHCQAHCVWCPVPARSSRRVAACRRHLMRAFAFGPQTTKAVVVLGLHVARAPASWRGSPGRLWAAEALPFVWWHAMGVATAQLQPQQTELRGFVRLAWHGPASGCPEEVVRQCPREARSDFEWSGPWKLCNRRF
jgi:hypothetical protein